MYQGPLDGPRLHANSCSVGKPPTPNKLQESLGPSRSEITQKSDKSLRKGLFETPSRIPDFFETIFRLLGDFVPGGPNRSVTCLGGMPTGTVGSSGHQCFSYFRSDGAETVPVENVIVNGDRVLQPLGRERGKRCSNGRHPHRSTTTTNASNTSATECYMHTAVPQKYIASVFWHSETSC